MADNPLLADAKSYRARQVNVLTRELKNYWDSFSKKQKIFHKISLEYVTVSKLFDLYQTILEGRIFEDIDEEVQPLIMDYFQFNKELSQAGTMVKNGINKMKEYANLLSNTLKSIHSSKTLQELQMVPIPRFDWSDHILDSEIDELEEDWNEMDLKPKMLNYLDQVQERLLFENDDDGMDTATNEGRRI